MISFSLLNIERIFQMNRTVLGIISLINVCSALIFSSFLFVYSDLFPNQSYFINPSVFVWFYDELSLIEYETGKQILFISCDLLLEEIIAPIISEYPRIYFS